METGPPCISPSLPGSNPASQLTLPHAVFQAVNPIRQDTNRIHLSELFGQTRDRISQPHCISTCASPCLLGGYAGLRMTKALNDWSMLPWVLVGPIAARAQPPSHFPHATKHITRTSPSPPFSSPWPALEPKQRPRRSFHLRRQMIKVLILRSAKGHLPLTLAGKRPQGNLSRKGGSRKRGRFQESQDSPAPVQSRGRKRKQSIENALEPSPDPDPKRQRTSPTGPAEDAFGEPAISSGAPKHIDPIAFWVNHLTTLIDVGQQVELRCGRPGSGR
jgi:hypothetical protein